MTIEENPRKMVITVIVTNHLSDMVSDYKEVDYDYDMKYQWNNTCPYYILEFDAKYDGYMVLDMGSQYGYTTDMVYHKGHNRYLIPTDDMLKMPYDVRFYERR